MVDQVKHILPAWVAEAEMPLLGFILKVDNHGQLVGS